MSSERAYIIKRDGKHEVFDFKKITDRMAKIATKHNLPDVDYQLVVQKVIIDMRSGMTTSQLDDIAAVNAMNMGTDNPDYADFGRHIYVSNMHKNTPKRFSDAVKKLAEAGDADPVFLENTLKNAPVLDAMIQHENDHKYSIVGYKTLENGYLLKAGGVQVERPQYMLMRIAVTLGKGELDFIQEMYNQLSERKYTHATPTCFNSGLNRNGNMSSCFLVTIADDSIQGILNTHMNCGLISKAAGGIGLSISNVRARGSRIRSTQGLSNGVVPMLMMYESLMKYVDQGGGKRKGSLSPYLEMWHRDLMEFIRLVRHDGGSDSSELRSHGLYPALWIPDLFMKRLFAEAEWTLFCPEDAPLLQETWGDEFEKAYLEYERTVPKERTVVLKTVDIIDACADTAFQAGMPYMMFKDAANRTSNQQHLGTIKSSNLCTEIIQYSSADEIACCNLASIALQRFCTPDRYDFEDLGKTVRLVVRALDRVIDTTSYPCKEAKNSNLRHRPIGLGVQGLADVFIIMRMPFDSPEARELNKKIFVCIYWHAVSMSVELAIKLGPFSTFEGSPTSKGLFQFDLWKEPAPEGYDWEGLRKKMMTHGIRNSLLTTVMPTVSTSVFLGSTEMVEPIPSNFLVRQALAGDFAMINRYLVDDLKKLNLWSSDMKFEIIRNDGSIQNIEGIPDDIKKLYKTVWEISQHVILQYARDRAPYICQSQSTNLYLKNATSGKYTSLIKKAWELGLVTGVYYLRTISESQSSKFAVPTKTRKRKRDDAESVDTKRTRDEESEAIQSATPDTIDETRKRGRDDVESGDTKRAREEDSMCSAKNRDDCLSCSS